jgi:glycosyltransferase involved in cell wall biosynthesis
MKLAYVCADPGIPVRGVKGASVHLRSLAGALSYRGHDVLLACARTEGTNPVPEGVRLIELPGGAGADWLRAAFLEHGTEAVLERHALGGGAALEAAASLELPCALEVNAPLVDEASRFRGLEDVQRWRDWERALLTRAPRLIVVSTAIRRYAVELGVDPTRVSVVPNGVDQELFGRGDGLSVRSRLGLGDALVVGFAGSLKPWHGVRVLVEAFAQLPFDGRLLVVGTGPELESLQELAVARGVGDRSIFTGAIAHGEVPDHVSAMDIATAPFEPMPGFYFSPLKVAEYMAAGRAVVASRQGDIPELIGNAGVLVAAGDVGALRGALVRLGRDSALRRRLGQAAMSRARSLTWDTVAGRVEGVLCAPPLGAAR